MPPVHRKSRPLGLRRADTDPVDESAASFYIKNGFKQILVSEARLLISTTTLARYNPEIVNAFKAQPQAIQISFGSQRYFA
jgi:hypothetical protein